MILINFSHPITPDQLAQIAALTGREPARILAALPQFDEQEPFTPQLATLLDQVDLTPAQWQTEPILLVPPALSFITAALLAELHGRMGYFPPIVRIRPVAGVLPRRFEVAEIIDLQALRERARLTRETSS